MFNPRTILTILFSASYGIAASIDTVDLGYGQFQGKQNSTLNVTAFYGLRYAQAPTASLRWRAPVAIEDADSPLGLTNATSPGPQCMQTAAFWALAGEESLGYSTTGFLEDINIGSSEDCLRLDVIVPMHPQSAKLPVVVQIHGGGYISGSSTGSDGSNFVSGANGTIIWVQIQYRLGPWGFLAGKSVQGDGVANAGLLDQRLALEWIQRHIEKFGGDAAKVTIWGESAGGGSATAQLIAYGGSSTPPFRAMIAEYPWWQPFHDERVTELQYEHLLSESGCVDLPCLRNLSSAALLNASQAIYDVGYEKGLYGYGDYYFGPIVDGDFIQNLPSQEFSAGNYAQVPILVDHASQEGLVFTNFSIVTENQSIANFAQLWPQASPCFLKSLFKQYPDGDFSGSFFNDPVVEQYAAIVPSTSNNIDFYKTAAIFADFAINCATDTIARSVSRIGQPVYKLRFATGQETHGAISTYLLSNPEATDNADLARALQIYYLSFVVDLDPNTLGNTTTPHWPKYVAETDFSVASLQSLEVNSTGIYPGMDMDVNARCDFLRQHSLVVQN